MAKKKLSELKASDEVMVELGNITQRDEKGEDQVVDKARNVTMTKAGWDAIEKTESGFAPTLNRKVKLLGTVKYSKETDQLGNPIQVPSAEEFAAEPKTEEPAA